MSNKIALLDLDNTLADYDSALIRDMKSILSPDELQEFNPREDRSPHMKARVKLIRNQHNWWLNLAPLKIGFDIVELLRKHDFKLYILTRAPRDIDIVWSEKAMWCKKYLPGVDITITQDKSLVNGDMFVDDWTPSVDSWLKNRPRGLAIMPAHPWNLDYKHPQIIRYDGSNIDEVNSALVNLKRSE